MKKNYTKSSVNRYALLRTGYTKDWSALNKAGTSCLLLIFFFLANINGYAQIAYTQAFDTNAGSWAVVGGYQPGRSASASLSCSGGALKTNLYNQAPQATFTSPSVGNSNGGDVTFSYSYRILDYGTTTGTPANFGSFAVQYANAVAGPWTTVQTVGGTGIAHVPATACATKTVTFAAPPGVTYVRFLVGWSAGDYNIVFDNIALSQGPPPSCSVPTGLAASAIASSITTVNISWTAAGGTPLSYEYALTNSATPPATGTSTTATSVSGVPLPQFNATNYLHVRSVCDGSNSTWATREVFLGYCRPTTTYGCTDGDVIARVVLNTLDNNSGTGCPSGTSGYSNYTTNTALTTTLQAGASYGCTVYAGQYNEGYAAWIDYNDDGVFDNATERIGYSNGRVNGSGAVGVLGSSATFPIVLSCNPAIGPHALRVRAMFDTDGVNVTPCANNLYGEIEDYVITISAADACPAPALLTATGVTYQAAQLSWQTGCAETNWEIVFQAAGTGAPVGAGTPLTAHSYSVTDLTPQTAYEYYVRAACTPGTVYSNWSGPYTFTTTIIPPDCSPAPIFPLDQEGAVAVEGGIINLQWQAPSTGTAPTSYNVYAGTTSGALGLISNVTTTNIQLTGFLYDTLYYWRIVPVASGITATGCTEWLFKTQLIPANDICSGATSLDGLTSPISSTTAGLSNNYTPSCSGGTAPDSFYMITVEPGYTLTIGQTVNYYDSVMSVFYGNCDTQTAITCFDEPDIRNVVWQNNTGSVQSVYWVQDGYNGTSGQFTLAWTLTPPPPCPAPISLTITPTSLTEANLSWGVSTGTPISFEYAFTTTATPPASGTSVTATSISNVAGTTDTTNYLHVRAFCGEDTYSAWATTSASLGYCRPVTTYGCNDGDVIARVVLNTLDNNSGTGCPSGTAGYSNYTTNPALTTTLQAGSSYSCTVYAGQYSEGYAAWIDYNDDGIFDNATERIGYSNGLVLGSNQVGVVGSSASFPIVLSCNPSLGQHRLRVRAMFDTAGSLVTPCGSNSYGETEDYVITITAADPCPAPHTLTANTVTETAANLTWTQGCAESSWEIVVQPVGTGAPSGSGTVVTSTTYAATTTAGISYEYYVRGICEEGVLYSPWVGPYSFSLPQCPAIVYPLDTDPAVTIVNGIVTLDWDVPATGGTPTSYGVYIGVDPGDLDLIATVTGTSIEIVGFDYNSTYYWQVMSISNSGTTTGCAEYSFTTAGLPANDVCDGATSLDALTSPLYSTTIGLNDDYTPACDDAFDGSPDAFYTITVPAGYTLTIGQTANDYDSVYAVFYGSCDAPVSIDCADEPDVANVVWTNTTGSSQVVYWVQDGYEGDYGQFILAWSLAAPACFNWVGIDSSWTNTANWCGGVVPTATSDVVIPSTANNPVITGTALAHNLTVGAGATLTVATGATLSVDNILSVNPAGTLTIANNGALLQGAATATNDNAGKITIHKSSNPLYRLDYTMWSSPVAAQNLLTFSPATSATRFYEYKYASNGTAMIEGYWSVTPGDHSFEAAKGYLIRMPNADTHTGFNEGTTSFAFDGTFTGTPNNGNVSIALSTDNNRFTAVGNPYPSPISVADFFTANSGKLHTSTGLYLWRKRNSAASSSYATLTQAGYTANPGDATTVSLGNFYQGANATAGNWVISQGQGFIVKTATGQTNPQLNFTNSMRRAAPGATQGFFRTAQSTASKLWLNMKAQNGTASQALIAYMEEGTTGLDYGYDGLKLTDANTVSLYSLAENAQLAIQARPEFDATDVVPMGFTVPAAGEFTVGLDHTEGVFEQGQVIYLKDNAEGIIRNISDRDYTFTSEAGTFEGRFEVVYRTSALGTDNPTVDPDTVIVYKQGNTISINTGSTLINGVTIFDIRGRQLYSANGINDTKAAVNNLNIAQQVIIVEVNTVKGKVSKRVVF
ncbi:GEVED domain-containing protein [Flavobacterium psychrotrophum]|uniref:GEVED domain-containing protein n=1 Tax=Flavobacterium psychrotrophum TaxID=2294119 RepID=UPI000E317F01|nr:GEVED domain-containing protein [Flavobacterium psychrotrophum]